MRTLTDDKFTYEQIRRFVRTEGIADVVVNDLRAFISRFAGPCPEEFRKLQRPYVGELASFEQLVNERSALVWVFAVKEGCCFRLSRKKAYGVQVDSTKKLFVRCQC